MIGRFSDAVVSPYYSSLLFVFFHLISSLRKTIRLSMQHKQPGAASLTDGSASDDGSLVNAKQSDGNNNNNNNNNVTFIVSDGERQKQAETSGQRTGSVGVHLLQKTPIKGWTPRCSNTGDRESSPWHCRATLGKIKIKKIYIYIKKITKCSEESRKWSPHSGEWYLCSLPWWTSAGLSCRCLCACGRACVRGRARVDTSVREQVCEREGD